jgi:hypothetical protein
MEFKAEASLIQAIASESINEVREVLCEYIRREPGNIEEIMGAVNYSKELLEGIFDSHNNKGFKDIEQWNKEYFLNILKDLNENFSEIRFQHACLVGAHIYPRENYNDTVIINNTKPVTDMELQVEKLKTSVALGLGLIVGFALGKRWRR